MGGFISKPEVVSDLGLSLKFIMDLNRVGQRYLSIFRRNVEAGIAVCGPGIRHFPGLWAGREETHSRKGMRSLHPTGHKLGIGGKLIEEY